MKEFVISEAKAETAVLVGLITKEQDEAKTKEYLDELEFLADTAGAVTVKRFTQKVGNCRRSRTISRNARMPTTTGWISRTPSSLPRACWTRRTLPSLWVW